MKYETLLRAIFLQVANNKYFIKIILMLYRVERRERVKSKSSAAELTVFIKY